jgi:hypothetical protein
MFLSGAQCVVAETLSNVSETVGFRTYICTSVYIYTLLLVSVRSILNHYEQHIQHLRIFDNW